MKLIDKDALVAEIERRINAYQKNFDKADNKIAKLSTDGRIAGLKGLRPFIDTLEVKEIPEWKPAARAYLGDRLPRMDYSLNRVVARDEDRAYYLTMNDLYQLPKAQKGENNA